MPKHKRHPGTGRRAPFPGPGLEECRTRIEALIARGKSRDAVEAAKHYLKHAPGPAAEALAVKAYTARIEALQASGLHREAQAIGALVRERFPAHQAQVAGLMRQSAVAAGHVDALLAELVTTDAARQRELEAILTRGVTDPAVLAESPVLPAERPLKRPGDPDAVIPRARRARRGRSARSGTPRPGAAPCRASSFHPRTRAPAPPRSRTPPFRCRGETDRREIPAACWPSISRTSADSWSTPCLLLH